MKKKTPSFQNDMTMRRVCVCVCIYIYIYIYNTMEYYLAIKKNKILPFATTWIDLEGIMLNEISETQKDKYCMTGVHNHR